MAATSEEHYDDYSFSYFVICFLAIISLPLSVLLFFKLRKALAKKTSPCNCPSCLQKLEELEKQKFSPTKWTIAQIVIWFFVTVLMFYMIYSVIISPAPEVEMFDPYEILGIEPGASLKDIKKAFFKLSLEWHPDKSDKPNAQEKFVLINKAHETLTDPAVRERWEKYGNPDGPGSVTLGLALPSFLVSANYQLLVLAVYVLVIIVLLPAVSLWFWFRSSDLSANLIQHRSLEKYQKKVQVNISLRKLLELLCESQEFVVDIPQRTGDGDFYKNAFVPLPPSEEIKEGEIDQLLEELPVDKKQIFEPPPKQIPTESEKEKKAIAGKSRREKRQEEKREKRERKFDKTKKKGAKKDDKDNKEKERDLDDAEDDAAASAENGTKILKERSQLKAMVLLYAHLSRLPLPSQGLKQDQRVILSNIRHLIINGMMDHSLKLGAYNLRAVLFPLFALQMSYQALWHVDRFDDLKFDEQKVKEVPNDPFFQLPFLQRHHLAALKAPLAKDVAAAANKKRGGPPGAQQTPPLTFVEFCRLKKEERRSRLLAAHLPPPSTPPKPSRNPNALPSPVPEVQPLGEELNEEQVEHIEAVVRQLPTDVDFDFLFGIDDLLSDADRPFDDDNEDDNSRRKADEEEEKAAAAVAAASTEGAKKSAQERLRLIRMQRSRTDKQEDIPAKSRATLFVKFLRPSRADPLRPAKPKNKKTKKEGAEGGASSNATTAPPSSSAVVPAETSSQKLSVRWFRGKTDATKSELSEEDEEKLLTVHAPYFPEQVREKWWLLLSEDSLNVVFGAASLTNLLHETTAKISFQVPEKSGVYNFSIWLVSENYVGFDMRRQVPLMISPPIDLEVQKKKYEHVDDDLFSDEEEEKRFKEALNSYQN